MLTDAVALKTLGLEMSDVFAQVVQDMARSSAIPPHSDLFAPNVYDRGALTLHALRQRVDDRTFFRVLPTYATRYRYANATTPIFIAVANTVSKQDLQPLLHTWLYAAQVPALAPHR